MKPLDSNAFRKLLSDVMTGKEHHRQAAKILIKGYEMKISCLLPEQYIQLKRVI